MENFFGGLLADKSSKLAGSGQNPTAIGNMGNSMARVKQRMTLPTEISAQQVIKQNQDLGKDDAEMELGREIISNQEKLLTNAVKLHQMNTEWSAKTMKADLELRRIEAEHKQSVARYSLNAATEQAYTDGFTTAYQMSAEIFD